MLCLKLSIHNRPAWGAQFNQFHSEMKSVPQSLKCLTRGDDEDEPKSRNLNMTYTYLDTKQIKSRSYQVTASFSTTADLSWSCGSSRERGSHKGPHGPGRQGFQSPPLPDSARSGPQLPPLRSGTRER